MPQSPKSDSSKKVLNSERPTSPFPTTKLLSSSKNQNSPPKDTNEPHKDKSEVTVKMPSKISHDQELKRDDKLPENQPEVAPKSPRKILSEQQVKTES